MELKQGYKQTDLGVIPDDWDITFLNKISVITRLAGYFRAKLNPNFDSFFSVLSMYFPFPRSAGLTNKKSSP